MFALECKLGGFYVMFLTNSFLYSIVEPRSLREPMERDLRLCLDPRDSSQRSCPSHSGE